MKEINLKKEPAFILTSDQDWTPAWAAEVLLQEAASFGVPLHVFRTNPCPVLDRAAREGTITQGWHPNFMPGSSHGSSIEDVIRYCQNHFPGARSARAHCFFETTQTCHALAKAGITVDSQCLTRYQENLLPLRHWTGISRLPVFFEDDVFFGYDQPGTLDLSEVEQTLFSPGLKILNFHATFVACNIPSLAFYEERKTEIFKTNSPDPRYIYDARGTKNVFRELASLILSSGYAWHSFRGLIPAP